MLPQSLCMGCMEEKRGNLCPSPETCGWTEGTPAPSVDQLPPRTNLFERYLLGRALGQGAFGITYIAYDLEDERKIAVKEYFPRSVANRATDLRSVTCSAYDPRAAFYSGLQAFLNEARDLKRFGSRPGLVTVLRAFETNGTCYMAMDFSKGKTLAKHMEGTPQGRLCFRDVLAILLPPMEALAELHKYGVFHLDINPNHVIVSGSVGKLLDFGGAKRATRFPGMTMQIWDLGFLALEQFGSSGLQGVSTDVYALGATFYFCLTGVSPLPPTDRLIHDHLRAPSELGVDLPQRSEAAIMRALCVMAKGRYDTIEDFQRDINPEAQGGWWTEVLRSRRAGSDVQGQVLRIFLCHSSRDKPTVRRLYKRLRSDGLDPWLDEEELLPGQDWEFEIKKAVRRANLVIVCLSRESVDQAGYVHKEIQIALDAAAEQPSNTIYLIPLRLDGVEVPEGLRRRQWVDLFEERGYERLMKAINVVKPSRS